MQQLIVILIGVIVLVYVLFRIYKTITSKSASKNKCSGCNSCALK